ncbi:BamA/OMP85 family outer membrane protein [Blastopirellula retiformator]|uniref:Translocation and assembly module TamA n=1 Tax=Blastopirellula retiformator TaxID=2527970 RepID=A0A5C5V5U7_9BACT|nr:BamA/TamA family outer membrane protein [Blastopirellula retiformator]TWT33269.1 Translocation and assembly module TamA precursor [Blastopirellula retiformator]
MRDSWKLTSLALLSALFAAVGCTTPGAQVAAIPSTFSTGPGADRSVVAVGKPPIVRAQDAALPADNSATRQTSPGNANQYRGGMPASGAPIQQAQYTAPPLPQASVAGQVAAPQSTVVGAPTYDPNAYDQAVANGYVQAPTLPPPASVGRPLGGAPIYNPPLGPDQIYGPDPVYDPGRQPFLPGRTADILVNAQEAQTGRFQFGVGVNSDAGVTGSIVVDERNFDYAAVPTSWDDVWNGRAFRGAGQGFRLEALPGTQVQRYMATFTEPYLFRTNISMNLSGYYFDRIYRDWNENRVGGRIGFGYRLTPDLSVGANLRLENVDISDPSTNASADLNEAIGSHDLFSGQLTVTHDTRDQPFAPTEGHLVEFSFEQAFGTFSFPRAEVDMRRYFLLRERADGSGRHTLGFSGRAGFSGSDTPIFENYFAGGYSTLRGFDFRGIGPVQGGVYTGGPFRVLGSVEYMFPITADDMLKGVIFTDVGTVQESVKLPWDEFDIAPGFGLRISVPALGQAPIALDFAFPVNKADSDRTQVFSFFIGYAR